MLRTSTRRNFNLYVDEAVSRAVDNPGFVVESFGEADGYGFYALVDMSEATHVLTLTNDEQAFLTSNPWAILSQDCNEVVDVTYYHSERAARDEWFLHERSYDQYMAECEKDSQ